MADIQDLFKFVTENTVGIEKDDPSFDDSDPRDVGFFKVAKRGEGTKEELIELVRNSEQGMFGVNVNPYDGRGHNYMELGGWIGDQEMAMRFMGLSAHFGLTNLITPRSSFGDKISEEQEQRYLGNGFLHIQSSPEQIIK
ncbi:hypothetical protein N9Z27_01360 [Alphaproteobacteria bacterium]|nr:hypothetical protein [Alphaproteobacteria bacterium]